MAALLLGALVQVIAGIIIACSHGNRVVPCCSPFKIQSNNAGQQMLRQEFTIFKHLKAITTWTLIHGTIYVCSHYPWYGGGGGGKFYCAASIYLPAKNEDINKLRCPLIFFLKCPQLNSYPLPLVQTPRMVHLGVRY